MGAFQKVREALVLDVEGSLRRLGVNVKQKSSAKWYAVLCPFCEDKSGSCSIATNSLHLNCNQCQKKADLFRWYRELNNLASDWDACKALAEMFHVKLQEGKRTTRLKVMSPKLLKQVTHDLLELDEAEHCRKFLEDRALWDPQKLEEMGIGFMNGQLVFSQKTEHGELMDRCRVYRPGGHWGWSKGSGLAKAIWPAWKAPGEGDDVWLLEGEWDVLVARWKLFLHAYSWSSPQAPLDAALVPAWMKGRRVHICYDNDTFQPLGEDLYAPDQNKRKGLERRRQNLIHGIGDRLRQFGCEVHLHVVPILPTEQWGADFRDWYEKGGRDTDDLKSWPLEIVLADKPKAKTVDFHEVFEQPFGQRVTFNCQLNTVDLAGIVVPTYTEVQCSVGQFSFCNRCDVPSLSEMGIDWKSRQDELAFVLHARDPEREVISRVLKKPPTCNTCSIKVVECYDGHRWTAVEQEVQLDTMIGNKAIEASDKTKHLSIISPQPPSVSSSMLVTGTVYNVKDRRVVIADKVQAEDDSRAINIKDHAYRLEEICPWATNKVEAVAEFVQMLAKDLAANVTRINERDDVHTAVMLAYHSALWVNWNKRAHRGFLDIGIIGETRTGKSVVVRTLRDHVQAGQFLVGGGNASRVGLTAGITKDGQVEAGLFPRNHGKLLCLDEMHRHGRDGNIIGDLLGARDTGILNVAKIHRANFPSACRFILVGNTIYAPHSHPYICQHFLDVYGSPENLSRMDFGVYVDGDVSTTSPDAEHRWEKDLAHACVMRAWGMRPEQIIVKEDAEKLIQQYASDWRDLYSEELPLFTSGEKSFSIRRIAVAVANLCFSHPVGELNMCEVRTCHVEWAANWLQHLWVSVDYPAYSIRARQQSEELGSPSRVEFLLMCRLAGRDYMEAVNALRTLFGEFSQFSIHNLMGSSNPNDAGAWIGSMVKLGALTQKGASCTLTRAGLNLVRDLIWLAEEHPEEYVVRHDRVNDARQRDADVDMTITDHIKKLKEDGRVYGSTETNLIPFGHDG